MQQDARRSPRRECQGAMTGRSPTVLVSLTLSAIQYKVLELTGERHKACTASESAAPCAFSSEPQRDGIAQPVHRKPCDNFEDPRAAFASSTSQYVRRPLGRGK